MSRVDIADELEVMVDFNPCREFDLHRENHEIPNTEGRTFRVTALSIRKLLIFNTPRYQAKYTIEFRDAEDVSHFSKSCIVDSEGELLLHIQKTCDNIAETRAMIDRIVGMNFISKIDNAA